MSKSVRKNKALAQPKKASRSPATRPAALFGKSWWPASKQPIGGWYVTTRAGEDGCNITERIKDDEWADCDGATTVTHSTFLPPTHFMPGSCVSAVVKGFMREGIRRHHQRLAQDRRARENETVRNIFAPPEPTSEGQAEGQPSPSSGEHLLSRWQRIKRWLS